MALLSPFEWPDTLELTPKEVLVLLVDLNERYDGAFIKAWQEMVLAMDLLYNIDEV